MLETIIAALCFIIVFGVTGFALVYFRGDSSDTAETDTQKKEQ